jgi:uncharacterized membrane protein (DUF373 family)
MFDLNPKKRGRMGHKWRKSLGCIVSFIGLQQVLSRELMAKGDKIDYIHKFEQGAITVLIGLMVIVVALSIADLGWNLIQDIFTPPILILDVNELLNIFAMFLLVLIGIELIETLKINDRRLGVRTEVIILVALIALARKIITLDFEEVSGISVLGIAALVIALGVSYAIIKRTRATEERSRDQL